MPVLMQAVILFITVSLAASQNVPQSNSTGNCPPNLARQYISAINHITESTLSNFGRAIPILRPLTTPLTRGLTRSVRIPPTVEQLQSDIIRKGLGMNIFASTLLTMLDKWNTEAGPAKAMPPSASTIRRINEITRATMVDLGERYPGLRRLTNPLSSALAFNTITARGSSIFNRGLPPSTVDYNLKLFSGNITEMTDHWAETTARFLRQEQQQCL